MTTTTHPGPYWADRQSMFGISAQFMVHPNLAISDVWQIIVGSCEVGFDGMGALPHLEDNPATLRFSDRPYGATGRYVVLEQPDGSKRTYGLKLWDASETAPEVL